jgi:hypothetical protein
VRPDDGVSSLGPSRLAIRLHATGLPKKARTLPANGETHIASMVQLAPVHAAFLEESWAGGIDSAGDTQGERLSRDQKPRRRPAGITARSDEAASRRARKWLFSDFFLRRIFLFPNLLKSIFRTPRNACPVVTLVAGTTTDNVTDTGTDSYSLAMTGTETLGSGGTVTGGSDSFSWTQSASDLFTLVQSGGGTSGQYTQYQLTVYDQLIAGFTDAGTDILGSGDSILAGSDTYSWNTQRDLASTVTDTGNTLSPCPRIDCPSQ